LFAVLHLARIALAFGLSCALISPSAAARADDTSDAPLTTEVSTAANGPRGRVWYEDGLNVESAAGNFSARFELRGQFRYTDIDLDADSGFGMPQTEDSELKINRARFKMGGNAGRDWMKYYTEYELKKGVLLDLWIAPQPDERLGFRIGQYKVPYNRERFDSSRNRGQTTFSYPARASSLPRWSLLGRASRLASMRPSAQRSLNLLLKARVAKRIVAVSGLANLI